MKSRTFKFVVSVFFDALCGIAIIFSGLGCVLLGKRNTLVDPENYQHLLANEDADIFFIVLGILVLLIGFIMALREILNKAEKFRDFRVDFGARKGDNTERQQLKP